MVTALEGRVGFRILVKQVGKVDYQGSFRTGDSSKEKELDCRKNREFKLKSEESKEFPLL